MKKDNNSEYNLSDSEILRKRAEEVVFDRSAGYETIIAKSPEMIKKLVHDLSVHQIKLEMQNDNLRRIQEELKNSRDKYTHLYDFSPVGYYSVNENGIIEEANLTGAAMFGVERKNLIGMPFTRFVQKQDQDIFYKHRQYLFESKTFSPCELRLLKIDGQEFYGFLECIIVIDPITHIRQIRAAVNDITDKKTIEIALQKSEEKYKNILNNFKDGYFEVNLSGDITFLNSSLCTILGYSAADLQGKNFREFCDKANDTIYEKFNQVYRKGKPLDGIHWILIRKDGSERFVEISISLIDDDKKVTGFRGVIRDITQHIQAEEQKEKLERQLRHAQKMEAIGTLAGGVAHDLNNILSGLVSYPELLLLKIPIDSPLRKSIQTIQKSGEKAAAIVQDLLTLARRGLPALSIVNLNDIIAEHLKSPEHENLFTYQPIVVVKFQPGDNLLNISASNVHISKILLNLITNAAEAMPEGGTIKISTENMYIDTPRVGYHDIKEGEYIKLQIKDGGTGISPEEKERIFEPFYTKKKMGRSGSGLGMAMVWGAVHDHNGYIEVHSTPSVGTTISVYFPAVRSESLPGKTEISLDLLKGNNESILVVDDILEQRELAAQMVTQLGYRAETVSSGEEAIDYIKINKFDLLIIDMIMDPGIDGLEAYKEIIKIRPFQKAIIATGYSTSERITQLQELGAGACLKKPYLIDELARAVKDELDK